MANGTSIKGKSVESTFENLVTLDNPSYDGLDDVLRHLQDALGNRMPIQVSKDVVNITETLQLNGVPFNITAEDLTVIQELTNDGYIEVDGGQFK
jgi:hypothetical protein